jgi:hypothetical protein
MIGAPLLGLLTEVARKKGGLPWWSSSISERNTYGDSLYHHDLLSARRLGSSFCKGTANIACCREQAVITSLPNILQRVAKLKHTIPLSACQSTFSDGRCPGYGFFGMDGGALRCLYNRSWAGKFTASTRSKRFVIHSCMDDSYFGEDGAPHDRYFNSLADELRNWVMRSYTMLVVQCQTSKARGLCMVSPASGKYLIPEDYYTLWDYTWAAGVVMQQLFMFSGKWYFQGLDITSLVREACWQQSCRTEAARFVLYYRLIERLSSRNIQIDAFIDMHENMITEKPQVIASADSCLL